MERQELEGGYYWVRRLDEWLVAKYDPKPQRYAGHTSQCRWWFPGWECEVSWDDIDEVGEPVKRTVFVAL